MKIPNKENWFNALQFHIHISSELSVDGKYYPTELHVVHQETNEESFAVFGMFIDNKDNEDEEEDQEHEVFEHVLKGWEASTRQTDEYCAVHPQGNGEWTGNSVLESRQLKLQCNAVATGVVPEDVVFDEASGLPKNMLSESMDDLTSTIPNIYQALSASDFGIYSYRGGLTTPPCTEIVHWNLLDTPLKVSKTQVNRLYELILCFVEITTCKHATIANEAGYTNRPVQALQGRTVTHRCPTNGTTDESAVVFQDPLPPTYESVNTQPRRCVLGGDGGPLQLCWTAEYHNHFAFIFPWFVMALGLVVFFLITRYCHWFPYTASMFLMGTFMGIAIVRLEFTDQLSSSIRMWEQIDAETILLVFLPGLLFRDAYCSNVFLFMKALPQALLLAFPAVLAGTCMTACVGYYILPYGWSWSFCMTFGAILSATDPVAVSALLAEVGAPPRLKTHISGESMLNDGSAIVFFTIFSQIFLFELGIPGVGTDIDVAMGFALFFRMSLGAVAVGIAFSLALLLLVYLLNRRFNSEESIVQVFATITTAYLSYYVAEAVFGMSGVISVVTCGVATQFAASSIFNDPHMMEKFWVMVEHILNSLLFVLGGVVWGTVISGEDPDRLNYSFTATDWGYLMIVYVLVTVIRGVLIFCFYPLFSRCGLKSNLKEALFMVWGGLRGAVGIALAIALDKELMHATFPTDPRRKYTSQLFGLTGGIAFLTLVVNGTLAGPLLRKLGLADIGEARQKVVVRYRSVIQLRMLGDLIKYLGHVRFAGVEFSLIKKHVAFFDDLSTEQIRYAVKYNKEFTSLLEYKEPNLTSMKSYMSEEEFEDITAISRINMGARLRAVISMASIASLSSRAAMTKSACENSPKSSPKVDASLKSTTKEIQTDEIDRDDAIELRKVFVELLSSAYDAHFDSRQIDVRDSVLVFSLKASLEFTSDTVAQGEPLNDWHAVLRASQVFDTSKVTCCSRQGANNDVEGTTMDDILGRDGLAKAKRTRARVKRAIAFIEAHKLAQISFKNDYCNGQMMTETEVLVVEESEEQIKAAEESFLDQGEEHVDINNHVCHVLCSILLSKAADLVGNLTQTGLFREQEAEDYLHTIDHDLNRVEQCFGFDCDGSHRSHTAPKANTCGSQSGEVSNGSSHQEKAISSVPVDTAQKDSSRSHDQTC